MRILWLSHLVPYPPKGGVQQRSYNLLRQVSARHEVVFLGFNQAAHLRTREQIEEGTRALEAFCTVFAVVPIPCDFGFGAKQALAFTSMFSKTPYSIAWLRSPAFFSAVEECISACSPAILYFDTISVAPYREVTGAAALPTILNHHNIESDMLKRRASGERNPFLAAYFRHEAARLRIYERKACSAFDLNVTCSKLDSKRLEAIAPRARTLDIPNGVDLEYFFPTGPEPLPRQPHSLVFAGRLNWYPNASAMRFFVQELWPLLKVRFPDISATVIGRNPDAVLRRAAKRDPALKVTGFVPDVRPYLERAEVYICPIFDGGGTKLKVLDAMAMSCAIVAHPIACEGINVVDERDVLLGKTPHEFVALIERVFSDRALATRLRANARAVAVAEYSFKSIGARLAAAFEAVSAEHSLRAASRSKEPGGERER
jgi:polysaccharide biosynthesis protein PslH